MNSPLLGLDIGLSRTGIALSESGLIAQPLTVLEAKPPHLTNVIQDILELIRQYEICTVVVGVPYSEDGSGNSQELKVEHIINQLEEILPAGVTLVRSNEFHSTRDAALLYPTTDPDSAAAAIILQDYLDQNA